jgi:hypothetical protein
VLVKEVRSDSPAARAGIATGDIIVGIGQWEIISANDIRFVAGHGLSRLQSEADGIRVEVIRNKQHYGANLPVALPVQATAPAAEEPTFKAYPLTGNVEVVFELVRSLLGRSSALIRLDRNLLLVSGREADHEKIEAVFAQIYEGEEFSLRPYPALPGRSYDTILAFVEERLADSPEAKLIRNPRVTDSLSTRYPFHVWGRQSDHDKVQEILDQIEAEVRKVREGD